jgi:hypothetical protein
MTRQTIPIRLAFSSLTTGSLCYEEFPGRIAAPGLAVVRRGPSRWQIIHMPTGCEIGSGDARTMTLALAGVAVLTRTGIAWDRIRIIGARRNLAKMRPCWREVEKAMGGAG